MSKRTYNDPLANEKLSEVFWSNYGYEDALKRLKSVESEFIYGRSENDYPVETSSLNDLSIIRNLIETLEPIVQERKIKELTGAI